MTQYAGTIAEQLLATGREEKPAADAVEKLEPQSSSRSLIYRDKADWPICSCSAAFDTVPRSATATNVRCT